MDRRRITSAHGGFESYPLLAFVIVAEGASMVDVTRFFRVCGLRGRRKGREQGKGMGG